MPEPITTKQTWIEAAASALVAAGAYPDHSQGDAAALWPLVEPLVTRAQAVTWSCTTDHVTFPGCGTCGPCRQALADGWRAQAVRALAQSAKDEADRMDGDDPAGLLFRARGSLAEAVLRALDGDDKGTEPDAPFVPWHGSGWTRDGSGEWREVGLDGDDA